MLEDSCGNYQDGDTNSCLIVSIQLFAPTYLLAGTSYITSTLLISFLLCCATLPLCIQEKTRTLINFYSIAPQQLYDRSLLTSNRLAVSSSSSCSSWFLTCDRRSHSLSFSFSSWGGWRKQHTHVIRKNIWLVSSSYPHPPVSFHTDFCLHMQE